ncbi:hypothetical protein OA855_01035 [Pelagibacteraceae bacterium]|nr:hypothetical protein [Pelagibacteraceae bacterium]MDC3156363.1 hypothetical protein [Pelagibacteraceae bacterium]
MAEDTLQSNFANLKKLLDSKTITIEQFNNGIDKLFTNSEEYKSLKELFKNNIIIEKDYLDILENLIFEAEDLVEKSNIVTDQKSKEITKEIELSLIITQVGQRVPLSLNAKVDSEEILSLLINENKVKEIIINEKSNNFFSRNNIKSFKNLKINFNNQKKLKGKGRISVKSFADVNLVMWWDIDLSNENPTGEIVIEIPGKGPQIKLEPN